MTSTNKIPSRWLTGTPRPAGFIDGPDEAMWHAHRSRGEPQPTTTYCAGFVDGVAEGERRSPLVAELAEALRKANLMLHLQGQQLGMSGRSNYARAAHAHGLSTPTSITGEPERVALLARAGVKL